MTGKYDDIIHLPRPVSVTHPQMSTIDRAAQFSPFAALTGYEEAIEETGRITGRREECSDTRCAELDHKLHEIMAGLDSDPKVRITRFVEDPSKEGGTYVRELHQICKVDLHRRELLTINSERIPMDDVWELEIL